MVNVKTKKILFVITQSEMGGAQRFVLDMASALNSEGNKIIIAAGGNGPFLNHFNLGRSSHIETEIQTISLKHLKRGANPIKAIMAIFEIGQLIKQEKPDILFLCSTMAGILGSIAASRATKQKVRCPTPNFWEMRVVYRIGGWAFNDPRSRWQKKLIIFLEKITAKYKDKIIVNSEFDLQSALSNKIAPADKIVKIYNGINPAEINFLSKEQARQKLGLESNSSIIGTIANFYPTKGLEYLITAIHELEEVRPPQHLRRSDLLHLVIIGEGKERKNLENLIKKYNLQDKVKLLSQKPNAKKYLKAFDIFVLPSLKEGFPWVILEAMAAGVPIIATSVGAVPEIIKNNQSGFIVPPKNSQILSKKIQDLLKSPELRNQFVQNASIRLALFSKEQMIAQIKKQLF